MTSLAPDTLSLTDAEALLGAEGADFDALLDRAGSVRDDSLARKGRPGVMTYSRKVFVPLTTLCRDRCHYCVFVDTPGQLLSKRAPLFMSDAQILQVVRAGAERGCKEALLTLGDRPEDRWPQARAWLDDHGFGSTIEYVAHAARLITRETGLLAHANPGVMTADELARLRPVSPSMGMMLETTSRDLYETPGKAHYGSPDKDPDVRLRVIEDAGRARIPFTTGILVGIGETLTDRAQSLLALRDAHRRHGHLQEVIVQNFRAKAHTAMRGAADPTVREYLATIAVARLLLDEDVSIQAPPNLTHAQDLALLVRAGVDDWGGVSPLTADHVNPERPWPHLDDLAEYTAQAGFALAERLTAHPEFVRAGAEWIDPALLPAVERLAAPSGLASTGAEAPRGSRGESGGSLAERAATDPTTLDPAEWARLLRAEGSDLETLVRVADDARRYSVGESIGIVVNRNLTSSGLRTHPADEGEFTLAEARAIAEDAIALGATELCVQGVLPAHVHAEGYLDLARAVADPRLHLHAYRPQDIADLVDRGGYALDEALVALRSAGVATFPGTGVKILDEGVRRKVAPTDLDTARWQEIVEAAHGAGLRSTSVLFYGHVESAEQRIAHLRRLRDIHARTGGFTEFVPIPLPGGGVPLVPGRAPLDEHRAVAAVSRLLLGGSIPHIQIPWTRHGPEVTAELLRSGGDDLGGTLLDGRVRPDAGIEHGLELPWERASRLAASLHRPLRERTTTYGQPRREQP